MSAQTVQYFWSNLKKKPRHFCCIFPIRIRIKNRSHIPEVVIYVSIMLKFAGYLAILMALLHPKFYGDRLITF